MSEPHVLAQMGMQSQRGQVVRAARGDVDKQKSRLLEMSRLRSKRAARVLGSKVRTEQLRVC
jgi:hypothetical protein